jgi:Phosphotransferase enzyme family
MTHELPVDPVLPGLADALDSARMRKVFALELRESGDCVEGCEVERVKYRPRRNCTVSYRLRIRRAADGSEYEQRVSARLCAIDDALDRLAKAQRKPQAPSLAGPGLRLLAAQDMLTWWWPNDSKLAAPRVLADRDRLTRETVPALVAALGLGEKARCVDHALEVVQYVPESRLTVRLQLTVETEASALETHVVFGKAGREPGAAQACETLLRVHGSAAAREGRLHVPRPLLLDADGGCFWQQGLGGGALLDAPPAQAWALMPALGAQLVALHALPLSLARVADTPQQLRQLQTVVEVMHCNFPRLRDTTEASARALADGWTRRAALPLRPLHGDLHPRNVLVDGDRLSLIDLDGMRMGPVELELGSWIADAISRSVLAGRDPFSDAPAWRALLQAYGDARSGAVDLDTLAWATGWSLLVQRAWRCVVNLKPGRYAIVPQLLALVAAFSRPHAAELL